jgi:hypothetical protein
MPDRERKRSQQRHGPSTQPVDEGIEGAIFDDDDTDRDDPAADVRDLDAAARGESRLASRSGEQQGSEGTAQDSDNDSGEETPPDIRPS